MDEKTLLQVIGNLEIVVAEQETAQQHLRRIIAPLREFWLEHYRGDVKREYGEKRSPT